MYVWYLYVTANYSVSVIGWCSFYLIWCWDVWCDMILVWNSVGMEHPCPPLLPPPSVWGPAISCLMTLNGIWLHWLVLFVLSVATANRYRWYWTGLCNTLLKVQFAQFTLSMCRYKCVGQVIVTCNSGVKWRTKWPLHSCGQSCPTTDTETVTISVTLRPAAPVHVCAACTLTGAMYVCTYLGVRTYIHTYVHTLYLCNCDTWSQIANSALPSVAEGDLLVHRSQCLLS